MIIIVLLISLLLENVFTNLISINSSFLIPSFSVIALIIVYPYFHNKNFSFIKCCAIYGLVYDLIFTNNIIFNLIVFVLIGLLIIIINHFISNNAINIIFMSFLTIVTYRFVAYILLLMVGYFNFNFNYLFKSIYSSLIINVIYGFIIYIITDYFSKKYRISKID